MGSREKLAFPVQRSIPLNASGNSAKVLTIETGMLLSQYNGRLYRQGRTYRCHLSNCEMQADVNYQIFTLPNNWFVHGAIKLAWKNYKSAMQDELRQLKDNGLQHAKWHDFRINHSDVSGTESTAMAMVFNGAAWFGAPVIGDTTIAKVTDTAGTEHGFNVVGQVTNSYNVMYEYAQALNAKSTPDADFAGPQGYELLHPGAEDLDHLAEQGDQPPYTTDYTGWWDSNEDGTLNDDSTVLVHQDTMYIDADGSGVTRSKTFDAPLGLIFVYTSASDFHYGESEDPELTLNVSPGKYKGVHSEPIFRHDLKVE